MPKVFATVPGGEVQISHPSGWQGIATNDRPALAPPEVAADLAKVEGLRVEPDQPALVSPRLAPKNRILAPDGTAPSEKE